jgi:hypothetical protein
VEIFSAGGGFMKVFRNNGGFLAKVERREVPRTLSVSAGVEGISQLQLGSRWERFNHNYFLIIYFLTKLKQ